MRDMNCKKVGSKAAKMPKAVMKAAEIAGGELKKLTGEELYILNVKFNDVAYNVVNEWVSTLDGDPTVNVMFAPPFNIVGTVLCPPANSVFDILREASSIAHHYAPFTELNFAQNFPAIAIPVPLPAPVMNVDIHHAKIALHALHARIQNPTDPNYPVISGLHVGSYVCTVLTSWANLAFSVAIYKN
jgi:hypothetical protein